MLFRKWEKDSTQNWQKKMTQSDHFLRKTSHFHILTWIILLRPWYHGWWIMTDPDSALEVTLFSPALGHPLKHIYCLDNLVHSLIYCLLVFWKSTQAMYMRIIHILCIWCCGMYVSFAVKYANILGALLLHCFHLQNFCTLSIMLPLLNIHGSLVLWQ